MVLIVALDVVPVVIATMNASVARAESAHMVRRAERAHVPVRVDGPAPAEAAGQRTMSGGQRL